MILNAFNDYWRNLAARYRSSPVPGFLAWWRSELASLIPGSLRRRLVPPRPSLWVVVEPGSIGLDIWRADGALEKADHFAADDDTRLLQERWQGLLQSFRDGAPEIRLCLPDSEALDCPVELPLAVESNLESALGFQLDQLTPFRVQQVWFDHRIRERDTEHGRPGQQGDERRRRLEQTPGDPVVVMEGGEGIRLRQERQAQIVPEDDGLGQQPLREREVACGKGRRGEVHREVADERRLTEPRGDHAETEG